MTVQEKFERFHMFLGKLEEAKNRPLKYALPDLMDCLDKDLSEMSDLLDDVEFEVKDYVSTRYSDYPDQMQILHEEHNQSIREAVGM